MTTGVVAALGAEARTLGISARRGDGIATASGGAWVLVSGVGCVQAEAAARVLTQAGATALVSWGMAGGLDPALPAGTICIPNAVIRHNGATFLTDGRWRELMTAAIGARCRVVSGPLLTTAAAVGEVAAKAAAFRETGAVVVDMESAAVAGIAALHGLPFIAVRAVVDTAADTLPDAVLAATTPGGVRMTRLLRGILRSPHELLPLVQLGVRYRAATRALVAAGGAGAFAPRLLAAAAPTRSA